MADQAKLWVFRGEADEEGDFYEYTVPAGEGMVILDAIHWIQQNGMIQTKVFGEVI